MNQNTLYLTEIITVLGIVAFALSAVLAAHEKRTDLFSVVVLGIITAVGGGTIRDILLGVPVFWSQQMHFIWIAIVSSLIGFMCIPLLKHKLINQTNLYIDAIAIAMFAIQGTEKAWGLNFALPVGPIIMGIITAIGGGLVRDLLLQRPTLFLNKELYAIPVMIGCSLHAFVLSYLPEYTNVSTVAAIVIVFSIRYFAISKGVEIPKWAIFK